MLKLYLWVAAEIVLFLVSVGVILPATISEANTYYVLAGIVYIVFALPVGLWVIPRNAYAAYLEVEKGFPNVQENPYIDPAYAEQLDNDSVQPSAPRKRGRPRKQSGK